MKSKIQLAFLFLILFVVIPTADAEKVSVGTFEFENFKILYIITGGDILSIETKERDMEIRYIADEQNPCPNIICPTGTLELIMTRQLFDTDSFMNLDEMKELSFNPVSEEIGIYSIPVKSLTSKEPNVLHFFNLNSELLDKSVEYGGKTNNVEFENDLEKRYQTNEKTQVSIENILKANDLLWSDDILDIEKALNLYDEAIFNDPEIYESWAGKYSSLLILERYDEALNNLDEITEHFDTDSSYAKGLTNFLLGNYDEGILLYEKALQVDPSMAPLVASDLILFGLEDESEKIINEYQFDLGIEAWVLSQNGSFDEAYALVDYGLQKNPENTDLKYMKSLILSSQGNYEESNNILEELLSMKYLLDWGDESKRAFWFGLAKNHMALGNVNESIIAWETISTIYPQDIVPYLYNSALYYRLGNYEEARENANMALELNPNLKEDYPLVYNVLLEDTSNKEKIYSNNEFEVRSNEETKIIQDEVGGCLIATATYGSELAPQVQQLREIRDNSLLTTTSGTQFMSTFNDFYYSFSPIIADYERENPMFREMVKVAITPMVSSLSILNYVDMDSESKVLGYGISLIILNGLMYVGLPVAGIVVIRKRF